MVGSDGRPVDQVVWVGTDRRTGGQLRRLLGMRGWEAERWRERLEEVINATCEERASQGLRLASIVPVTISADLRGGWTEGVLLHFSRAE